MTICSSSLNTSSFLFHQACLPPSTSYQAKKVARKSKKFKISSNVIVDKSKIVFFSRLYTHTIDSISFLIFANRFSHTLYSISESNFALGWVVRAELIIQLGADFEEWEKFWKFWTPLYLFFYIPDKYVYRRQLVRIRAWVLKASSLSSGTPSSKRNWEKERNPQSCLQIFLQFMYRSLYGEFRSEFKKF